MNALTHFAAHLTVDTTLDRHEYVEVDVEVTDGVLVVTRDGRPLAWFAAGQWTGAMFL